MAIKIPSVRTIQTFKTTSTIAAGPHNCPGVFGHNLGDAAPLPSIMIRWSDLQPHCEFTHRSAMSTIHTREPIIIDEGEATIGDTFFLEAGVCSGVTLRNELVGFYISDLSRSSARILGAMDVQSRLDAQAPLRPLLKFITYHTLYFNLRGEPVMAGLSYSTGCYVRGRLFSLIPAPGQSMIIDSETPSIGEEYHFSTDKTFSGSITFTGSDQRILLLRQGEFMLSTPSANAVLLSPDLRLQAVITEFKKAV
jgi:hypothetical protein